MQVIGSTHMKFIDFTSLVNWSSYALLGKNLIYTQKFDFVKIGNFLQRNKEQVRVQDGILYKRATIRINGKGISLRDEVDGKSIGTKNQFLIHKNQFLLSKIDARNGAFGVVPEELEGGIITGNFWTFDVNYELINPHYLQLLTGTKEFQKLCQTASVGTTNRNYLQEDLFLNFEIPLPNITEQDRIVKSYLKNIRDAENFQRQADDIEIEIENLLFERLGITKTKEKRQTHVGLKFTQFDSITEWGLDKIMSSSIKESSKFSIISIEHKPELAKALFRGKSPKYKEGSKRFILNQKCNRWNEIDLTYIKSVDEQWINSIDKVFFTKEGDVLINSTGEGTIGRATYIRKKNEGLLYDSHLLLLRLDNTKVNPELFVEIFNSEYGQSQVNDIKSAQATKQTELGTSNLAKIHFPLPDNLDVQNEIISKIKTLKDKKTILLDKSKQLTYQATQEFEKAIFS